MKPFAVTLLISILSSAVAYADESPKEAIQNSSQNSTVEQGKWSRPIRVQSEWEQYQTYALPAGFLSNMGFGQKATCAIALMKSMSIRDQSYQDFVDNKELVEKHNAVLRAVIDDGLSILRNSHSYLTDQELKEMVYQNLMQTEASLNATLSFLTLAAKGQVENKNKQPAIGIATAEDYKKLYVNINCADILQYDLAK
ncbi:hypothetical protein [Reinekea sp.]|jgi:hypothetical protein|uniref:hypothetical protein n=1 Tax=Reinekea sp. TaxID=1970455 RepID=UPI00398A407F